MATVNKSKSLGLVFAVLLGLSLPAFAQGLGAVSQGPLNGVNCPGAPLLGMDVVSNLGYTCGTNGKGWQLMGGASYVLPAAGGSTVVNTITPLLGGTIPIIGGSWNVAGKTTVLEGYATYSVVTGTPTLALTFAVGAQALATCTTTATTNAVTNFPVHFTFVRTTVTPGLTGTDEAHCEVKAVLGASATAAASTFLDNNTAPSTGYDHTVNTNLTISGTAAGASNAMTLRYATFTFAN